MKPVVRSTRRCAIYTRKSSEEGLEQSFNSLHAQREACEAYVASQAHEGWRLIKTAYDDGGYSGGSLERPALQRLLVDIEKGLIDVIVVYKVDRLTRALADFAKIVEVLDGRGVSFVSVTQQFNTTSSMGRLTLNVLLSFAQFEREVTGERIRDKFAASRKKGMWMGGHPPLGYDLVQRKLVVNESEAAKVRAIYERYLELGGVGPLAEDLRSRGCLSKSWTSEAGNVRGGKAFSRGALYDLLQNRIYIGEAVHKGTPYAGEHAAIVPQELWDRVQVQLARNRREHDGRVNAGGRNLLAGLLFDDRGNRMSPSHARKRGGKRYRYYVSQALLQHRSEEAGSIARVSAPAIEDLVREKVSAILPKRAGGSATSSPADQAEQLRKLVRRVEIAEHAVEIIMGKEHIGSRASVNVAGLKPDDQVDEDEDCVSIRIPIRLSTRSGTTEILTPRGERVSTKPCRNPVLIRAVARTHYWLELLESGVAASVADLAQRVGTDERYVSRLLKLAFLAPDIIDAILDGRQPRSLSLERLKKIELPLSWDAQRTALGFAPN